MEYMNRKRTKRGLPLLILMILVLAIVALTFTACSLFTDTLKNLVGSNSSEKEKTDDSTEKTEQGGQSLVVEETEPDAEEEQEDSGNPAIEVESNLVTVTSALVYDKAASSDFMISATHENMSYESVMGMGLTNKRVTTVTDELGSSSVRIGREYLSTFSAGYHYFYYCVKDSKGKTHYEPFRLEVVNSAASPKDLKIDYDIDCPYTYVTFKCDCGGAHTVSFDSTNYDVAEGLTRIRITKPVDKASSHTAYVTCVSSSRSESVTKDSPAEEASTYLTSTYSFMGHTADHYVEDDAEASDIFQYLIYGGATKEETAYLAPAVYAKIEASINSFLGGLEIENPWQVRYGLHCEGHIATFSVEVGDISVLSSGYEETRGYEENAMVSHYPEQSARSESSSLPIDSVSKKSVVRNVKELLAVVENGYRPIADGAALTIYNKARQFCLTHITDEMSDVQKLHVIYDYLAGEIDYDYSALNLYMVIGNIEKMSLADARATLTAELANDENGFSTSMKEKIAAARDSATTIEMLITKLKNEYLQRLSAFSAEGVFNDGTAVCEGISYAFMLLARIEGIECHQITGYATSSTWDKAVSHAWNKVRLEGVWYCVDATWGSVFMDDTKYITHRFFLLDESVFAENHKEQIGDVGFGVQNLALGDAEYYKSVVTATNHTLYVSNYADLKAAVNYYIDGGSNYIEFEIDPSYTAFSEDRVTEAIREKTKTGCNLTYSSGRVFVARYTSK